MLQEMLVHVFKKRAVVSLYAMRIDIGVGMRGSNTRRARLQSRGNAWRAGRSVPDGESVLPPSYILTPIPRLAMSPRTPHA